MGKITKTGINQGDLVDLLATSTGRIWIPCSNFDDIGGGTLAAVGSSTPVGMT